MRKVTKTIKSAFMRGDKCTVGNTRTDGKAIWLHGNRIVERREDGIYVNNAGWFSNTTRERLSAFCNVYQRNFNWFINGEKYDGGWIKVAA